MSIYNQLPRSVPEAQGVSSAGILAFLEAVAAETAGKDNQELHSFMMLRHGYVIAEGWWSPYGPQLSHTLFSLSKSFTGTAIGLAVAEGRLSIDDFVISIFPEDLPEKVSPNLAAIRVRHLLTMTTGHANDTMTMETLVWGPGRYWRVKGWEDGKWVKNFLAVPVDDLPGTRFLYDSGASYLLSAIIQKVTGQTLFDYLNPRLFEPLAINEIFWESCPGGINLGGMGLYLKTGDIAKFGQLYLQRGIWEGRRIIPQSWVEEATTSHIKIEAGENSENTKVGYGYHFWREYYNSYCATGAFGQYCIVLDELDTVIVITAALSDTQKILKLIWQYILPAISDIPLLENKEVQMDLTKKLVSLDLIPKIPTISSDFIARISGKHYLLAPNNLDLREVTLIFSGDECRITFQNRYGEHQINCGVGAWRFGTTQFPGFKSRIAACCGWTANNVLEVTMRYIETLLWDKAVFCFDHENLKLEIRPNIPYDGKERLPIEGRSLEYDNKL